MSRSSELPLLLEPELAFDARGAPVIGPIRVEGGRVVAVGPAASETGAVRVPLRGRMLLPGLANVHSHAFQRALRGRTERRAKDRPHDDFWTWRSEMYRAALRLDLDAFEAVAAWCYLDMLRAGFVSVGEFHYVHHDEAGRPYPDPAALSARVARAASRVGVRVTLLETAYARAGHGQPPLPEQRRFVFESVEAFLAHARAVRGEISGAGVGHGLAIHSVRACPRSWIEAVADEARREGLPLHVHACEQPAEIAASKEEHGAAPLAVLEGAGALSGRTTVVHATHLEPDDPARLAASGATVCVCPSTERNLGDGLCPIADLAAAGVPLAVGTDSHARIDAVDELRSLEDHERLRLMKRNVLVAPGGSLGAALLPHGVTHGARALGLEPPDLAPGAPADLIAVEVPVEGHADASTALDAWLVGGSSGDVRDVFVGGQQVLRSGAPTLARAAEIEAAALEVLRRLSAR